MQKENKLPIEFCVLFSIIALSLFYVMLQSVGIFPIREAEGPYYMNER